MASAKTTGMSPQDGLQQFSGVWRDNPALGAEWQAFHHRNFIVARALSSSWEVPADLEVSARCRALGGFVLFRCTNRTAHALRGMHKAIRGAAEIGQDSRDPFKLFMPLRSAATLHQFGRSQHVEQGSHAFLSLGDLNTCETWLRGSTDDIVFLMPRGFITQRVRHAEDLCLRPPVSSSFERLALGTFRLFEESAWTMTPEDFVKAASHTAELLLHALEGRADVASSESSIRAANLARVKSILRERLGDPALTLTEVARTAHLSLGYLHKLFRSEGQTAYEYLKGVRLGRARELLESSSPAVRSVTDICYECGFSDKSYFSRAFKRAFDMAPRDVRRGML